MICTFEFGSAATRGMRPYQEDHCEFIVAPGLIDNGSGHSPHASRLLATLADGMGGHVGGAVASQTAIAAFKTQYIQTDDAAPAVQRLQMALQASNIALAEKQHQDASLKGMGCTLIGALFEGACLRWVSVGDSLIYHYRNGRLERLNADHSMAPELDRMAARDEITPEQALSDPMRHALRSAMMGEELTLIDSPSEPYELKTGDWVIIASDGIETLKPTDIRGLIESAGKLGAQAVAERLIAAVDAAGRPRQDNTTIMVVHRRGPQGKSVRRNVLQARRHPSTDTLKAVALGGTLLAGLVVAAVVLIGGESGTGAGETKTSHTSPKPVRKNDDGSQPKSTDHADAARNNRSTEVADGGSEPTKSSGDRQSNMVEQGPAGASLDPGSTQNNETKRE